MFEKNRNIVVGKKQTIRAIQSGKASIVYISKDADLHVTVPIVESCKSNNIEILYFDTMKELGYACGIDVNAAAAAVLK